MSRLKKETVSGVKWGMLQKFTLQPLQLFYGMVLARLITPTEMGIVGLTAIFFAVANQLASAGFGVALIRKQDRTDADVNTMFWFNLAMSLVMGILLFLLAPWFASFYNQPELLLLTRVSAVMMFLNSCASVHWTLYQCRRDFKTPAIVNTITAIAGMPVCLVLAWMGWGVWALMWQNVVSSVLNLVIVWYISPWKPRFLFSGQSFVSLFSFGAKLAYGGILHILYREIRTFIIGKFYSPAQLGLYTRGVHVTNMLPSTISSVLGGVLYPVLATVQDDNERLISAYRMYIRISTLVIAWICMWLLAMGKPVVELLYGADWLGCAVFLRVIALGVAVDHISSINLSLLMVKGEANLMLGLEIVKKIVSLSLLLFAATISVEAICWAAVIYTHIAIIFNTYFVGRITGLTWWKQQKDYMPYVIYAAISCAPAWVCTLTDWHFILQLVVGGSSAFLLYFGGLHLLCDSAYKELYNMLRQKLGGRWLPPLRERS